MSRFIIFSIFCLLTFHAVNANTQFARYDIEFPNLNTDPIDKFWEWFKANESRLKTFESDPDKYLNELFVQIKKVHEGLAIELEAPKNGIINLIVSANGDIDLFDEVQNVIRKAPRIAGWVFFAFRQRVAPSEAKELKLKVGGYEFDPNKMKFFPVVEGDSLNIIIYIAGVTDDNFNEIAYGGLLLLDNILGEYDCVTKVNHYDFQAMPKKKEELTDLLPLLELAAYVDKFHETNKKRK